ncbi:hypothetical protein JOB18_025316 [Solea senegalensis]|uniref:HMG box domain-containing protein n=1 Tax=Solea senegalensis TaxID=28829 RepID=A0AAV6RR33_SOLSE|nr:nucleolar transcription factor 1-like [Solea senegalensis]KAG7507148.1 hypothetical protein JOB18_025316 [Solea senegalensis]
MTDINPGESEWTSGNLLKLFSAMKSNTPSRFMECAYTTGLKKVDWKSVAFHPFSPEACRLKWRQIVKKMRLTRSLTELLVEAEENLIIGPQVQKKPPPPSVMFYHMHNAKFKEQHPELAQRDIMRVLYQKYKRLPEEEKAPYGKKYKCAYREYLARKRELSEKGVEPPYNTCRRRKESEPVQTGTEGGDGLPPRPHFNAYILFCKEQMSSMDGVGKHNYAKVCGQRWKDLTDGERKNYQRRCRKLKRAYDIKLDQYLKKQQLRKSGDTNTEGREALSPNRPSDSEDEDIEESSSSDDDDDFDCNEEEEEEEEEDEDITFQMY